MLAELASSLNQYYLKPLNNQRIKKENIIKINNNNKKEIIPKKETQKNIIIQNNNLLGANFTFKPNELLTPISNYKNKNKNKIQKRPKSASKPKVNIKLNQKIIYII